MKVLTVSVITALVVVLCMLSCSEKGNKNPVGPDSYETCKVTGKVIHYIEYSPFGLENGMRDVNVEISGDTFYETTVTDDNGDYSFAGLLKGDYTLKASIDNYVIGPGEMHITVRDSIVVVDDFCAYPYSEDVYIIVGKVTNNNNMPVFGVKVKIAGKDTTWLRTSGANGFFEYRRAKEGETYSLVPEKEGVDYIFTPDTCYVTVDEHIEICNFSAINIGEPLHSISGRFVNFDGSSLGSGFWGPSVFLENEIIGMVSYLDRQGFYHFIDLKDGIYTVSYFGGFWSNPYTDSLVVEIQGEDVILPDVKQYNFKTSFKVYGRVVDSDGKAMNDVKVHYYFEKPYRWRSQTQTDFEGNFQFDAEVELQTERNYLVFPEKNGWTFSPDTSYVNLKWIEYVGKCDVIIPDFIGHDHTVLNTSDYFPLSNGIIWTYIRTENDEEPHDLSINVAAKVSHGGQMYHRLSEPGPWNFTDFRIEDNSVYAFSDEEEVLFLKIGVMPGSQWESGVIAGTYTRIGTFLGTETVETPAGTFENCAHFESKVTYGETSYDSYDLWYASGVGLVRSVKVVENYGRRLEYIVDELKEYQLP